MIVLGQERLVLSFPEVTRDAVLHVAFHRTLRVPHDNRDYRLPDLGRAPLHALHAQGMFALPLQPAEALWLSFLAPWERPFAVKVECGGIDALTGEPARDGLHREPQDYVPVPAQTWLDGCRRTPHDVQQMTADACVSSVGACDLRITVCPTAANPGTANDRRGASPVCYAGDVAAPGMRLHDDVIQDALGVEWDVVSAQECCIRCVPATEWRDLTGVEAPAAPTAADYARAGVPWLDTYAGKS